MTAVSIERRASNRQRVLKGGRLAFDGGGGVDCMVRSLSPTGARVDVSSPMGVPESFTLVIEADHFARHCHQVWSRDKQIGVAFD